MSLEGEYLVVYGNITNHHKTEWLKTTILSLTMLWFDWAQLDLSSPWDAGWQGAQLGRLSMRLTYICNIKMAERLG